VYASLIGKKYITIGGGNVAGRWSKASINTLVSIINAGQLSNYQGLALDVEECYEVGLASSFLAATAAAKARGMETMVTVSNSAPYLCDDARELVFAFFADSNLDYLSPQVYSPGQVEPNFWFDKVTWEEYRQSKAQIIPSIAYAAQFSAVQNYFSGKGISLAGFVQWGRATLDLEV